MSYFEELRETNSIFKKILILLKPLGIVTGSGSNRLSVDVNNVVNVAALPNVPNVLVVGSVTNQVNTGSVNSFVIAKDQARANYNIAIRNNITF